MSKAVSERAPNRLAVAMAWQTMGVCLLARVKASAPLNSSTSPLVLNQVLRRAPATMAGAVNSVLLEVGVDLFMLAAL